VAQHGRVQDAENGAVRADPERKRSHDDRHELLRSGHRPHRILEILDPASHATLLLQVRAVAAAADG
jgi:hypothetical protein